MSVSVSELCCRIWPATHVRVSHEMPVQNELSKQNIQDRYHGNNDPVARKILNQHATRMGLAPPEDKAIVRLVHLSVHGGY